MASNSTSNSFPPSMTQFRIWFWLPVCAVFFPSNFLYFKLLLIIRVRQLVGCCRSLFHRIFMIQSVLDVFLIYLYLAGQLVVKDQPQSGDFLLTPNERFFAKFYCYGTIHFYLYVQVLGVVVQSLNRCDAICGPVSTVRYKRLYFLPSICVNMAVLDIFSILITNTISTVGIVANLLLLAAIKYRSPPSLKSYSILLSNSALIDLVACASALLIIERPIVFPDMTVSVYNGPCSRVSGFFCHIMHAIMVQTHSASMYLIVIEACYRYYAIQRHTPKPMNVIMICIALFLPTLVAIILTCLINDPSDKVRAAMAALHPQYRLENYVMEGHVDINSPHWLSKAVAVYGVSPVLPSLIIVFIMRRKTIKKLDAQKHIMTAKTRKVHKTLVKVITMQAFLPIFFFCSMAGYVLMKKNVYHTIWIEYATGLFHPFMPLLSPIITLFHITPYREFVRTRGANQQVIISISHSDSSRTQPESKL